VALFPVLTLALANQRRLGRRRTATKIPRDEDRNRLVLSHRRALVERKMNRLEVGEVVMVQFAASNPTVPLYGGVSGFAHL